MMGSRSDIAVAYSKAGWADMQAYFASLSPNDQGVILDLIQDADKYLINDDNDSALLSWTYMKSGTSDMILLMKGHDLLFEGDFLMIEMDDSGTEDSYGSFYSNPFGICVNRSIFINEDNSTDAYYDGICHAVEKIEPTAIKAETVIIINDCVCPACSNNKCSSSEASCWKCGASLR
jgi:hypothetical protein